MKMEYMIIGKLKIFTCILNAVVEVYDRMGNMVFRRRNYINSESVAFNGFSKTWKNYLQEHIITS